MKRIVSFATTLLLLFFTAGCEKIDDGGSGRIEVLVEPMSGNTKVLINGATSTWVDNDSININGTPVAVVRNDNGHAYIDYPSPSSVNRAFYPSSLKVLSLSGDDVTFELPNVYHYRANGSGQLLELPMAARSEGGNPLKFKHLTGALCIMVKNISSGNLTLQSVTLESDRYRLSGECAVDFSSVESIGAQLGSTALERRVTMVFDTGYTLASNATLRVMLPVLPVESTNHFTISVRSYRSGQSTAYLTTQSQTSANDHSLARNYLGYAPIDVNASGSAPVLESVGGAYVVSSPLEFSIMAQAITNGWISENSNITLLSDIDMTEIPITTIGRTYGGTFDGNNHIVKNLTINSIKNTDNDYWCALFRQINSAAIIRNITLDGLILKHNTYIEGKLLIGGLAAEYEVDGGNSVLTFSGCNLNISNIDIQSANGAIYFGGLLGEASSAGSHVNFTNCHVSVSNANIVGQTSIWWGGLIAYTASSKTNIASSSWLGNVSLSANNNVWVGGLVGRKNSNEFKATNCHVEGSISVSAGGFNRYLGALIGLYNTPGTTDITGTTSNISFTLAGNSVSVDNYGINQ